MPSHCRSRIVLLFRAKRKHILSAMSHITMKATRQIFWLTILLAVASFTLAQSAVSAGKPKLALDEFFNSVGYTGVAISPDGNSVVLVTERADWDQKIFRDDLWLYRGLYRDDGKGGSLIQLTQSGHDSAPRWSPDGLWIAFLSDRKSSSEKDSDDDEKGKGKAKDDKGEVSQIYLISPAGGEAIPVTEGEEEIHSFTWSADSRTIYFSTRNPWTKAQKDDYKKQWKDVVQYRTAERGDTIFALDIATALARHAGAAAMSTDNEADKDADATPGARAVTTSALRVEDLINSPDGGKLAFTTNSISQRQEKNEDVEIYVVDVARASQPASAEGAAKAPVAPRRVTNNQALEEKLHWSADNRHIFFTVENGDVSGPYRNLQQHLYWVDSDSGAVEPWGKDFMGSIEQYTVQYSTSGDSMLASARIGTEVPMHGATQAGQALRKLNGWDGTYEAISAARHSPRIAFVYSSLQRPAEIYLADSADKLDQARPITGFNKLFTERELPQGKPYRWKADDGSTVEGMLIYPPGKFEAKHLPMFTFIHGGPADADGNHFEADWYVWGALAATDGWLVFEPNYRGSTGYGDKFALQIVPGLFSRPGKDILEGVDALVKEGIADADHLTIGGYSYGGYMTNWLITQTTRFKAAVTGAGGIENVAAWGNDDTTADDAYYFGGRPWEARPRYDVEAAIFQMDKVKTPTHMVAGADDIRVPVLESYLLEHALYSLGVPNKLLIFPGEGHSLDKNPWHGKIKVREEMKWLQVYGGLN